MLAVLYSVRCQINGEKYQTCKFMLAMLEISINCVRGWMSNEVAVL
jgi:hypothetical protein